MENRDEKMNHPSLSISFYLDTSSPMEEIIDNATKLAKLDLSDEHKRLLGEHGNLAYEVDRTIRVTGEPTNPIYSLRDYVATRNTQPMANPDYDLCYVGMNVPVASGEVKREYSHQELLNF